MNITTISLDSLKQAVAIKEQIAELEQKLADLLGGSTDSAAKALADAPGHRRGRKMSDNPSDKFDLPAVGSAPAGDKASDGRKKRGKGTISDEGRRRISEAQKLRWAIARGLAPAASAKAALPPAVKALPAKATASTTDKPVVKRILSPETRARLSAAAKNRWANYRANKNN